MCFSNYSIDRLTAAITQQWLHDSVIETTALSPRRNILEPKQKRRPARNGVDRAGRITTAVSVRYDVGVHRSPVQLARSGRSSDKGAKGRSGRPIHRCRTGRFWSRAHMHGHVLLDEQRA